ncbi:MAG: CBS domain-containing protein [Nanoarchaeota archaeon]|nr:CBS domain-containing protein [Nanoarchaeota archaeon]
MKNDNIKLGIKVGDVMIRNFISAKPEISVIAAVELMVKKRIGSLILQDKGVLKGILTEKDIMWALSKKRDLTNIKSIDICTRKITTIRPSADVYDAVRVMRKSKFRRLPVVIKKKVIGYLTLKDILRIQPELFDIARHGYEKHEVGNVIKEGVCDKCERFDLLYYKDGKLVCEKCQEELEDIN